MNKPIAYFDLDNTLADYEGAIRRDYEIYKSPNDPAYNPNNKKIPHLRKLIDLVRSQPNWWANLEKYKPGFEILDILRESNFNIHIASKGPRNCQNAWTEKLLWVQQHVPDAAVTITQDKGNLKGDILVDDFPPYLEAWLRTNPDGLCIMPVHYYNENFKHDSVIPYNGDKQDLIKQLQNLYNR